MDFRQRGATPILSRGKKRSVVAVPVRAIPTIPENCNSTSPARHCDESPATSVLNIDPTRVRLRMLEQQPGDIVFRRRLTFNPVKVQLKGLEKFRQFRKGSVVSLPGASADAPLFLTGARY